MCAFIMAFPRSSCVSCRLSFHLFRMSPRLFLCVHSPSKLSRLHVPAQYGKAATVLELCAPGTHVIGKYGKAVLVIDQDFVSGKHASIGRRCGDALVPNGLA